MKEININTPLSIKTVQTLRAGDYVNISGIIYTARDAAHKRMLEEVDRGIALPFKIQDSIIYYMGPSPNKPNQVIGAAGPTTSGRMDKYTGRLLDMGLRGMLGKGERSSEVISHMITNKSVYIGCVGGAGALISKHIIGSRVIAYEDLGAEAIRELHVVNLPGVVIIDCLGNNLYTIGKEKYQIKDN